MGNTVAEIAGALSGLGAWLGIGGGTTGMAGGMAVAGAEMTAEEMLLGLGKVDIMVVYGRWQIL